jgi:hypothetical protein
MLITFGLLGLSIGAVWLPPIQAGKSIRIWPWLLLFIVAIATALQSGYLNWQAVAELGLFGIVAYLAGRSHADRRQRILFGVMTVPLALALALHQLPGFHNPMLIADMKFSADAAPYTQHANFDKAAVGLILLALATHHHARTRVEWKELLRRLFPIAIMTAVAVIAAAMAAGYVRPSFKLSWYTPIFLATNLLFVCVAEEAFFRGFLQDRLSSILSHVRFGEAIAIVCSAVLFGIAHLAGGPVYMGIAMLAGLGYAYSYAVTTRIEAPILVHFGLNAVHFIGFTYPRIQ